MDPSRIYLDNNATTRPDPRVLDAMLAVQRERWGNPGSAHEEGRLARRVLSDARGRVAARLGVPPSGIVFTSCATESSNLALRGLLGSADTGAPVHVLATAVEHPAVLEPLRALAGEGRIELELLGVDAHGRLDLDAYRQALRPGRTRLVCVMAANNETGVLYPVREIVAAAHEAGALVHVDAVQAIGRERVDPAVWQADLLSLSAHKFHGPRGVGILAVRPGVALEPLLRGGGQEWGRRSGTENPAGAAGAALALELAMDEAEDAVPRMRALRDRFEAALLDRLSGARVLGAEAPRNACTSLWSFEHVEAEPLLLRLDHEGIAISVGSACSTGAHAPSHVLEAMGLTGERAVGVARISLSRESTEEELERVLAVLPKVVERLRRVVG